MLLQTMDGLFAADGLLADLDGDELADVAIGRLPALTAVELANMIAKISGSGASIIGFQEFEPQQAQAFLKRYEGQAVASTFRSVWLPSLARRQDWPR